MASGRNQVDYTDINFSAQTYKIDGVTIQYDRTKPYGISVAAGAGLAVTLIDDDTVALTRDGDGLEGKLVKVEIDGFATVQIDGFTTLQKGDSGAGTATRLHRVVGATRGGVRGFVRDVAPAVAAELAVMDGEFINVADPDNLVIDL
jgi:hypothetical protein